MVIYLVELVTTAISTICEDEIKRDEQYAHSDIAKHNLSFAQPTSQFVTLLIMILSFVRTLLSS
jgi:diacylglycerol kinase